ncbi:hypothetical protein PoB_006380100 [Plakobranchus ocellatus]|uniref:PHR domain-containing protein n=1 Tax=Plakobranchus ocellatus TaxID=259542 RepID=A0AAV4CZQ5_9GAST|nr:hypothetical protein PoB_006380100 [Plakobranchus ocellatus]
MINGIIFLSSELSGHYEKGYSFLATISKEIEDDDFSTTVSKIINILPTHLSSQSDELHGTVISILQDVLKNLLPCDGSAGLVEEVQSKHKSWRRQAEFFHLVLRISPILRQLSQDLWRQDENPSSLTFASPRRLTQEDLPRVRRVLTLCLLHRLASQQNLQAQYEGPEMSADDNDMEWVTEYSIDHADFGKWLTSSRLAVSVLNLVHRIPSKAGADEDISREISCSSQNFDELTDVETARIDGQSLPLHSFTNCTKNPGHTNFRKMPKFSPVLLPSPLRSVLVMKEIGKYWTGTVRIRVNYTSPERPGCLGYMHLKGTDKVRHGSGWACEFRYVPCVWTECSAKSGNGTHQVTIVTVRTAAHVVCDDIEAKQCTVDFFFEDEADTSGVVQGVGIGLHHVAVSDDVSYFKCVVHCPDFVERLQKPVLFPLQQSNEPLASSSCVEHGRQEPCAPSNSNTSESPKKISNVTDTENASSHTSRPPDFNLPSPSPIAKVVSHPTSNTAAFTAHSFTPKLKPSPSPTEMLPSLSPWPPTNPSTESTHPNASTIPLSVGDFTWTTLVISHPHGCAKHVSVGSVVNLETSENSDTSLVDTKLLYTTQTCPGSSGAQVLVIGHARDHVFVYQTVHSCAALDGAVNKSGMTNLVPSLLLRKL